MKQGKMLRIPEKCSKVQERCLKIQENAPESGKDALNLR